MGCVVKPSLYLFYTRNLCVDDLCFINFTHARSCCFAKSFEFAVQNKFLQNFVLFDIRKL